MKSPAQQLYDDDLDAVPPDKRGGVRIKPPVRERETHIPASHAHHRVSFTLPNIFADELMSMFPDVSLSVAAKKYIELTVLLSKKGE